MKTSKQSEQCRTALKKAEFLADFRNHGIISEACRNAGVGRTTVFDWTQGDVLFAANMECAKEESIGALEQEARRRAFNGSDTLLIFLMKGELPDKYRERASVTHEFRDLSDEELLRRAKGVIGGGSKAGS